MTARKGEANVGDSNKISSQNNYIQMTGYVRLVGLKKREKKIRTKIWVSLKH